MGSWSLLLSLLVAILHAEDIRFCSIGFGVFGTATAKIAIQKGFKMVAAFTRYSKHTKTVGELVGMPNDLSLQFEVSDMKRLEEIIGQTKPDFCIDATNSTLADVFPHFRRLIAKGVHILTLSNEAIFPNTRFNWKPRQLYRALSQLAAENNVVILGGGFSDSILIPVIPSLAASMLELNRIGITLIMDIDGADEKSARYYGVGMTEQEFTEYSTDKLMGFGYWQRAVVEALADTLDMPLVDVSEGKQKESIALYTRKECVKVSNEKGLQSNALNKVLPNGDCAGMNLTVLGRAKGDLEIVLSVVMAIIPDINDMNAMQVQLSGKPNSLEFAIKNIDPYVVTGVSLLHRVPMVLNELPPGFHNVNELGTNKFWGKVSDWNVDVSETAEVSEKQTSEEKEKQDL